MFMSNERMDRGPRGIAHSLSEEAERRASAAPGSRSEARAEAGRRRLQADVRRGVPVLSSSSTSHDTVLHPYARLFEHLVGAGDPLWRR
jgi:hypothetical protein